jgi:hypothetical protein
MPAGRQTAARRGQGEAQLPIIPDRRIPAPRGGRGRLIASDYSCQTACPARLLPVTVAWSYHITSHHSPTLLSPEYSCSTGPCRREHSRHQNGNEPVFTSPSSCQTTPTDERRAAAADERRAAGCASAAPWLRPHAHACLARALRVRLHALAARKLTS